MSMTNEEAIERVKTMRWEHATNPGNPDHEAMTMAIEALEQDSCEDCISRAEAKRIVDFYASQVDGIFRVNESIDNLPSVQPKTDVLDKIKAEIISLTDGDPPEHIWNVDALEIIDKYRKVNE